MSTRRAGFTLLEVLLGIILFVATFLALSEAISSGIFVGGGNEAILVGTHLAQEKMEEIRNKSYSSIANEAKTAVAGFPAFQREVVATTPQTDLKEVQVSVYWTNEENELNTSLVTYVSNI